MFLGIHLATEPYSIAIIENNMLIAELSISNSHEFSENCIYYINRLFSDTTKKLENIKGIGITQGPGNYTSLRIGIILAKTIAQVLTKPVFPVSSLLANIYPYKAINNLFFSVIAARKNELNCALFTCKNRKISRQTKDFTIKTNQLINKINKIQTNNIIIVAPNTNNLAANLDQNSNQTVIPSDIKALTIAQIAQDPACLNPDHSLHSINPIYAYSPTIGIISG
jgi:tRNA threonylcarbamoyladenosine biosynthesis protein TsaB